MSSNNDKTFSRVLVTDADTQDVKKLHIENTVKMSDNSVDGGRMKALSDSDKKIESQREYRKMARYKTGVVLGLLWTATTAFNIASIEANTNPLSQIMTAVSVAVGAGFIGYGVYSTYKLNEWRKSRWE